MLLKLVPDKQRRKWGRCDRQKLDFLSNNYCQDALLVYQIERLRLTNVDFIFSGISHGRAYVNKLTLL